MARQPNSLTFGAGVVGVHKYNSSGANGEFVGGIDLLGGSSQAVTGEAVTNMGGAQNYNNSARAGRVEGTITLNLRRYPTWLRGLLYGVETDTIAQSSETAGAVREFSAGSVANLVTPDGGSAYTGTAAIVSYAAPRSAGTARPPSISKSIRGTIFLTGLANNMVSATAFVAPLGVEEVTADTGTSGTDAIQFPQFGLAVTLSAALPEGQSVSYSVENSHDGGARHRVGAFDRQTGFFKVVVSSSIGSNDDSLREITYNKVFLSGGENRVTDATQNEADGIEVTGHILIPDNGTDVLEDVYVEPTFTNAS